MEEERVTEEEIRRLRGIREASERIDLLHSGLKSQNKFLHAGQQFVAKKIFSDNKKSLFLQCGRNWGKSHLQAYAHTRLCIENPKWQAYIVAPERKQAYEIYWASGVIQNTVPREVLLDGDEGMNKSELRLHFKNGSFMKFDGADNHKALRGYKPNSLGCDEIQDWQDESWIAMEPNLLAKNALCLKTGTPPDRECWYTRHRDFIISELKRANKRHFYMECPTEQNPIFTKEALEELKRGFVERQEEAIWLREYMAQYVPGGARAIWGTLWSRKKFVRRHDEMMSIIMRNPYDWRFFTIADPGTVSCFAVLFAAYNPYTADIFLLDEIYERDRSRNSSSQIWSRICEIEKQIYPNAPKYSWRRVADEAEAWFINEIQFNFGEVFTPTQKQTNRKHQNVSLAKDLMFHEKLYCSDKLNKFFYEMDNFVSKENGDYPDKDDHLIDTFLYLIGASGYSFNERHRDGGIVNGLRKHNITDRNDWQSSIDGIGQYDFGRSWQH